MPDNSDKQAKKPNSLLTKTKKRDIITLCAGVIGHQKQLPEEPQVLRSVTPARTQNHPEKQFPAQKDKITLRHR